MKEYEVYAKYVRNAQVCTVTLNDETTDNKWIDFLQDQLIDVVYASDYDSAIKMVSEAEGIAENALYALDHMASSIATIKDSDGTNHPARFEACGFLEENKEGIEVSLPDGRTLKVYIQDERELKCSIVDENDDWRDINIDDDVNLKCDELTVKTQTALFQQK